MYLHVASVFAPSNYSINKGKEHFISYRLQALFCNLWIFCNIKMVSAISWQISTFVLSYLRQFHFPKCEFGLLWYIYMWHAETNTQTNEQQTRLEASRDKSTIHLFTPYKDINSMIEVLINFTSIQKNMQINAANITGILEQYSTFLHTLSEKFSTQYLIR